LLDRLSGRALDRIAMGLGSGGASPGGPKLPPATNGIATNGTAPRIGATSLRPPTPRQQARWKAIQQAQLHGLSMRATARLLGISRNTVKRYVHAGGPPGRQGAASSTGSDPRRRTNSLNS
ncbi:MAG: helix-turn-helix domain-containing protein, partial [Rhodococcus sp.]|nr:helix-turn-helix domain-containing protein [Rhodococcus sp. (in: high G+C Gram-positive bacteria)]